MRRESLAEWLAWQESLHPAAIDLGLDRVRAALDRLGFRRPAPVVITVGGTNGKGSTIAILDAMLRAGGFRTGVYTSPHLLRYNERIAIDGVPVSDEAIVRAFQKVDRARSSTLTYFEFGTLAAFELIRAAQTDFALLEVGLGGRLDAVNIVDADVSAVTSVGLDHTEWLGADIDSIAREKAAIFRPGRPALFAGANPPAALIEIAHQIGADLRYPGAGFSVEPAKGSWAFSGRAVAFDALPYPALAGSQQLQNAGCALAVIDTLADRLALNPEAVQAGLANAQLPGRFQSVCARPQVIVDVAHNEDAANMLARNLADKPVAGRTFAVVGMLRDKPADAIAGALSTLVDKWYSVTLPPPRGTSGQELAEKLRRGGARDIACFDEVRAGIAAALRDASADDRIVVFGSFLTVGDALQLSYTQISSTT